MPMERIEPGRPRKRERNPRGQGAKLRDDLVEAATGLIAEHGTAEAVTIRAVARRAGVSAPSVYLHFTDRDALLQAAVEQGFHDLIDAVDGAIGAAGEDADPIAALRAGCTGYVRFGIENPGPYRMVFDTRVGPFASSTSDTAGDAFSTLVDGIAACQAANLARPGDPFELATVVWSAMHGMVMLQCGAEGFRWPPVERMLDRVLWGILDLPDQDGGAPADADDAT